MFGRGDIEQTEVFRNMRHKEIFNGIAWYLYAIFEETVQKHSASILLNTFSVASRFKVYCYRVDAMNLLVGVAIAISDRDNKDQQVWSLFWLSPIESG